MIGGLDLSVLVPGLPGREEGLEVEPISPVASDFIAHACVMKPP